MPVVIEFESGLGNQLFQFAAGYTLALKRKTELIADTSRYLKKRQPRGRITPHHFNLKTLNFPLEYRRDPSHRLFGFRGYQKIYRAGKNIRLTSYQCPGAHTPIFDKLPEDTFLSGYFQDMSYFRECKDGAYKVIVHRLEKVAKDKIAPLHYNWGAIHLRLDDYLLTPEYYPDWFERYYRYAAKLMLEEHRCSKVLVFSDDPVKAKEILSGFGDKLLFAESNMSYGGALDLYRMSTATVVAISNSCFSWWAGYIASKTGSRIIAPRFWSEWCKEPEKLLYPYEWDIHGYSLDEDDDDEE